MFSYRIIAVVICQFTHSTPTTGMLGVDISELISASKLQCIRNSYADFISVRLQRSNGDIDKDATKNLKAAASAGYARRDGYIFPTMDKAADGQVRAAMENLVEGGVTSIETVWIDVERDDPHTGIGTHWKPHDLQANINFIIELLETTYAVSEEWELRGYTKFKVGIYSDIGTWREVTGNSPAVYQKFVRDLGKQLPLWYAKWRGNVPSFADYVSFGGWPNPARKQYQPDVTICGVEGIDLNYEQ